MNKMFPPTRHAGIFDAADVKLAVSPQEEGSYRKEVEASLPGQWDAFRSDCLSTAALRLAHHSNNAAAIKKTIKKLRSLLQAVSTKFSGLPPGGVGLFHGDTPEVIADLLARAEMAENKSTGVDRGNPRLEYRNYLAKKIAERMFLNNLTPSLVRDCSTDSWQGDDTYARLLRIGIVMVEGTDPEDLFTYMLQGLSEAKVTRLI